jgi:hypothetical protein
MKILAIEKEVPEVRDEDYAPHLKSEAKRAWELYQGEIFREIYFTDKHEAVLILECKNKTEAEKILASLPLVKNNLIKFDLYPLLPYPGFRRLFETQ